MKQDAAFWNRTADKYARQPIADEAAYEYKLELTQRHLTKDSRVLEIGCGTGSTAVRHAPFVKEIRAIDLSERMIAIACGRAQEAGAKNIRFEVADAESLVETSGSYDMVLALSLLHLLRDRPGSLAKMHGLLKPGGLLVASTACIAETMGWMGWVLALGRPFGLIPHFQVFRESCLLDDMQEAGFEIIHRWRRKGAMVVFTIARKSL